MTENQETSVVPQQVATFNNISALDEIINAPTENFTPTQQVEQTTVQLENIPVEQTNVVEQQPTLNIIPEANKPLVAEMVTPVQETQTPEVNEPIATPNKAETQVIESTNDIEADLKEFPALEAEIAKDAEEAKKAGDTVESVNTIKKALQPTYDKLNKPTNTKLKNILSNLEIDPNNIIIDDSDDNPLLLHTQLELVKEVTPDPVSPVIALKSGYRADMAAMNTNDKIELRNIRGSRLDHTTKVLRLIHSKIRNTSIGKLSYNKFIQITAEEDYDTLMFGIFSATYPNAIEYTMNCPYCRTELKLNLEPGHLIEVIDHEKSSTYIKEVLEGYERGEEFIKSSLVNGVTREVLPVTKTIVEIITPTIERMLRNLHLSENSKDITDELINTAKSIKRILILNIEHYNRTGEVRYIPIEKTTEIILHINEMNPQDLKVLRKAISKRIRSNRVEYRIPRVNCPNNKCNKEIANVPVDMTELIFFGIAGEVMD